jgi:hypothetical protein
LGLRRKTKMPREKQEVDIDSKVDDLEAAKEKYLSENTVISIGGYAFTPAKLMIAAGILSSVLGGLYASFEFYKDYMNMKDAIANYVSPDFTGVETRLTKIEKTQESIVILVQQNQDMVRAVRSDLKADIDRVEAAVDAAERRGRELDRDTRSFVNNSDKRLGDTERDLQGRIRNIERETDAKLRELEKKVDEKIKKAWENPLAK